MRPHDRPGDEVREEAQVDRGVDQARGLDQAPLDVDDVRDRLEREEADPDRQRDRQQRQRHAEADRVEPLRRRSPRRTVVLEHGQDGEIERHRDAEDPACGAARPRVRSISSRGGLVADRHAGRAAGRSASSPRRRRRSSPTTMNGFHSRGRDISAHESASTTGKKIANWTVGNSIRRPDSTKPPAVGQAVGGGGPRCDP